MDFLYGCDTFAGFVVIKKKQVVLDLLRQMDDILVTTICARIVSIERFRFPSCLQQLSFPTCRVLPLLLHYVCAWLCPKRPNGDKMDTKRQLLQQ